MDFSDLANRKLSTEIEKIEAEIAKLKTDTEAAKPQVWRSTAEIIKVVGAVFLGVAAAAAAVTTYRVTQLETRLAATEKLSAEKMRDAAKKDAASARKEAAETYEKFEAMFGKLMAVGTSVEQMSQDIDKIDLEADDLRSKRIAVHQLNEAVQRVVSQIERPRLVLVMPAEQSTEITTDITRTLTGTAYQVIHVDGGDLARVVGPWCELVYFNKEDEKEAFDLVGKLARLQLPLRVAYVPQASPPRRFTLRFPRRLRRLHEL